MAFGHGKNAVFKLGTAGTPATPVDISAYLTSLSLPQEIDTAETSVFGNASKTYITGLKDSTISGEGKFDPAIDLQLNALFGSATAPSFEYYPQGTTAGLPKYTGQAHLTGYEPSSDIGDAGAFSFELQVTGTLTRTTV